MLLLARNRLPGRFKELVDGSDKIDIAVAWARPCEAVEILAQADAAMRIAVGISNHFTDPSTLKMLAGLENVELRIVPDEALRIFHPKYYCFRSEDTTCWVGSANLTVGGLGGNVELVHEFKLEADEDKHWFECLWEGLDPDPWTIIQEYEKRYISPMFTPRPSSPVGAVDAPGPDDLPALSDIETWKDFVEGLKRYDRYYRNDGRNFTVLGETHSWSHTIGIGRVVVRQGNWATLTRRECYILRGFGNDVNEGIWGFFGTLRAGPVYVCNNENMPGVNPIRSQIQRQIQQVLQADAGNISVVAQRAMEAIRTISYREGTQRSIGSAAATRWLTMARPEYLVSVNSQSTPGLGKASNLPQDPQRLANRYLELLTWLHSRRWFNESEPDDPLEWAIWSCRGALVDVFVYKPED